MAKISFLISVNYSLLMHQCSQQVIVESREIYLHLWLHITSSRGNSGKHLCQREMLVTACCDLEELNRSHLGSQFIGSQNH